ncbi:MAG: winged helix DNA-binding domain-containing protein [Actinomycetota bacterium]|nr:winged helix DNA-binding domain-containing protein [Actinomycetota bacterium]
MTPQKSLTARRLNRATLDRQLLLRRERLDVVEGVRRVVALQAQEAASPYIALWNRLSGFDPTDLDAAFAAHDVVKAPLMRITLHAVHAEDYPAFHTAMLPTLRAARLGDRRFTETGLSIAEADALVPRLVQFAAQPRTGAECEKLLGKPRVWWALRSFAPLLHAPTGGPWSFGPRPSYVTAPRQADSGDLDASAQHLVRRYLEGFGPASVHDVAQFVLFPRSRARARDVFQSMAGTLKQHQGPDGTELFDVPGGRLPAEDTPAPPRLMAMWDSVLLAYADRSRVIPPDYRQLVTRRNGDVLPTLLVDGYVAGVWRPVDAGIEATAFQLLSDSAWDGLAAEARHLVALLSDRQPQVYRRYEHWWKTLPKTDVRLLPA